MANIDDLDRIAQLPEGWDSYGAAVIDARAVAAVRAFLEYRWAIVPLNDGGLQLEIHAGGVDLELEFGPDGRPVHLFGVRASDRADLTVGD